jgi:Ca2+-binding EF-hand superfamily protein
MGGGGDSGSQAYKAIKASLMKADATGRGRISKDLLIQILQRVSNTSLDASALEQFLNSTFPSDIVPIAAFLDYVFQRFPGLEGAQDADLSAIFQCIDKNGNGFLEKEEVLAAASSTDSTLSFLCSQIPALGAFRDVGKWEKAFKSMDTNDDGVISWFEFLQFFTNSGGPSAGNDQEDLVAVFMCIDKNGNGLLEKNEVLAAVTSGDSALMEFCSQVPALMPLMRLETWKASFEALDTNTDGVISWYEFSAFFADYCRP